MDYPSDWEEMALSEFSEINPHTEIPDEFYYVDLESVKDVFLLQTRKEKKISAPSRAKRYATKGDIFFQTVRPYQRNNYIFKLQGDYVFSTGYAQLRTKNNPDFLFYLIRQDKFVNDVLDNCTGTSYPAINPMNLAKIHIHVPPLAEQKNIADTLGTFDAHIKNLSELIEKKKAIRDGALDDLMSGRKRLKGFNGDWKVKKLGELCKIIRGASPRPIETYITHNVNGVNWIKISDAPKYGKYITHTEEKITQSGAIHSVFVKVGDLILSNSMSFGRPYILRISGYIHDGWLRLYDYKNFDKDYLCYALSSKEVYKQYVTFAAGSGVQNLNKNVVKNVTIPLPPLAEQKAIAETLTALDDEITALEAERDKIIQIRDGAMDDLLTGKVRLKF